MSKINGCFDFIRSSSNDLSAFNSIRFGRWLRNYGNIHLYLNEISSNKTEFYEFTILFLRSYFFLPLLLCVCVCVCVLLNTSPSSNPICMYLWSAFGVWAASMTICYLCENLNTIRAQSLTMSVAIRGTER